MRVVPIQVHVAWRRDASVPPAVRARVRRELSALAWELSQAEALAHDAARLASGPRAFLMPSIELRLPLYDARRRFRIFVTGGDEAGIHLADAAGRRLGDITLV